MKLNRKNLRKMILEAVASNYKVFDSSGDLQQLLQRKRALQKQYYELKNEFRRMRTYDGSDDRLGGGVYYDEEEINATHSQIKKIEAEIAKIDDILSTEHIT